MAIKVEVKASNYVLIDPGVYSATITSVESKKSDKQFKQGVDFFLEFKFEIDHPLVDEVEIDPMTIRYLTGGNLSLHEKNKLGCLLRVLNIPFAEGQIMDIQDVTVGKKVNVLIENIDKEVRNIDGSMKTNTFSTITKVIAIKKTQQNKPQQKVKQVTTSTVSESNEEKSLNDNVDSSFDEIMNM